MGRGKDPALGLQPPPQTNWVAAKQISLSYYIGETILFTLYIYILIMRTKPYAGLWLAGNEGIENEMDTTVKGLYRV